LSLPPPPAPKTVVIELPKKPSQTVLDHFDRGLTALNKGDNPGAIAEYTEALRLVKLVGAWVTNRFCPSPEFHAAGVKEQGFFSPEGHLADKAHVAVVGENFLVGTVGAPALVIRTGRR
jgi:hypothetical protein